MPACAGCMLSALPAPFGSNQKETTVPAVVHTKRRASNMRCQQRAVGLTTLLLSFFLLSRSWRGCERSERVSRRGGGVRSKARSSSRSLSDAEGRTRGPLIGQTFKRAPRSRGDFKHGYTNQPVRICGGLLDYQNYHIFCLSPRDRVAFRRIGTRGWSRGWWRGSRVVSLGGLPRAAFIRTPRPAAMA